MALRRFAHALSPSHARLFASGTAAGPDPYRSRAPIPGVAAVVAVASGKGGVGKSTTACNVAVAAAALGLRVGLLDADIYGPSVPLLMGLPHTPPFLNQHNLMLPPQAHGVWCQSMGLLLKEGAAAAWRGPMVMGALEKLIRGTAWPALDILFVDMPPGTGDAHISICQKLPLSGALIVSTPQEVALVDARRGVDLFKQVGVSILGMVENMAFFEAHGERLYVFGRGGVARAAALAGCQLLAEVPLVTAVREASDGGTPLGGAAPGGAGRAYEAIARQLASKLGLTAHGADGGEGG